MTSALQPLLTAAFAAERPPRPPPTITRSRVSSFTAATADGMPGITFVAAVKYDLYNETLNLTMIDGQNPFAEGKTQLQLIRCPDP